MSDIDNHLEEVRNHCERASLYQYFSGDNDSVTTAQVALDTAEDATLAVSHYENEGIASDDDGEKYLRLYGFLQATFLQQDANKKLHELFVGGFTEPADISAWKQLRELRNLTVGHPIEKVQGKKRRRAFITRVSLETDTFDYQVWHQETGQFSYERADLLAIYAAYKQEAVSLLGKVLIAVSGAKGGQPAK